MGTGAWNIILLRHNSMYLLKSVQSLQFNWLDFDIVALTTEALFEAQCEFHMGFGLMLETLCWLLIPKKFSRASWLKLRTDKYCMLKSFWSLCLSPIDRDCDPTIFIGGAACILFAF